MVYGREVMLVITYQYAKERWFFVRKDTEGEKGGGWVWRIGGCVLKWGSFGTPLMSCYDQYKKSWLSFLSYS